MKNFFSACFLLSVIGASPTYAVPPFYDLFKEKYGAPGAPLEKAIAVTKCNVCHIDQKPKKQRNDYGNAVSKYLKKVDFMGPAKKFDPKTPAGKKALADGLEKAGKEKSPGGQSFEQIIQGGKLP